MLLELAIFQNLLLFPCFGLARCKRSRRFPAWRGESGLVSVMMRFARHSSQYYPLPKRDRFLRSVERLWPRPANFIYLDVSRVWRLRDLSRGSQEDSFVKGLRFGSCRE